MKARSLWIVGLVVASLSALAGFKLSSGRPASALDGDAMNLSHLTVGLQTTTDIKIQDLSGRAHSLTEWTGKVLVVNFWATWCPPCVTEIPGFVELQTQFGSRGLQFVGIALDEPLATAKFSRERGINYPVLVGEDNVAQLMRGYGNTIGALPFTVVFNRAGKIVHIQQGEWSRVDALAVIQSLLATAPQQATRE